MAINLSHSFQRKISRWGVGVTLRLRLPEPPGAAGQVPHVGPAQDLQARPADPPGRQEVGQEPRWRRLKPRIDETVMMGIKFGNVSVVVVQIIHKSLWTKIT